DRLRRTRLLRGMSQSALAQACGLSQGAISNYENGTRRSAKEIFRIAQVLEVNPAWLSSSVGTMEPSPTAPYLLSEQSREPEQPSGWPFDSIAASAFWSLDPEQRSIIETAVAGMIGSFQKKSHGG